VLRLITCGCDLDQASAAGSEPNHIFFLLAPLSLNSSAIFLRIRMGNLLALRRLGNQSVVSQLDGSGDGR
jgi:hypothetical protein